MTTTVEKMGRQSKKVCEQGEKRNKRELNIHLSQDQKPSLLEIGRSMPKEKEQLKLIVFKE